MTDHGPFGGNLYLLTTWSHTPTSLTDHGGLAFDRNERFWGRKPLLRRIEYALYRDVAAEWSAFTQGKGDASNFPSVQLAAARATKGVVVRQAPTLGIRFLRPNWHLAPFDDVRVRQAFSLALDRTTVLPANFRALWQPTIHLVPEGIVGYNPNLTDAAGRKGKAALAADLSAARALASAYAAERCSGDYAKCPSITLPVSGAAFSVLGQTLIDQWQKAFPGWVMKLTSYTDSGEFRQVYQVEFAGWSADYADPQNVLSRLWMTTADYNHSSVSVPQADALLAQADVMSDQAGRLPLYQMAEQLLVDQGAAIPLAQPFATYAVRLRVVGWRIAPTLVTPLAVWQTTYIRR